MTYTPLTDIIADAAREALNSDHLNVTDRYVAHGIWAASVDHRQAWGEDDNASDIDEYAERLFETEAGGTEHGVAWARRRFDEGLLAYRSVA